MADQSQIRVKNLVETYEKRIHRKNDNRTEHELRIQDKYVHLVTTMTHVEQMVVEMHQDQKLTDQEKESIEQLQSVPIRAKEELLNIIMKKPRDVYDAFLNALNNTKQQHIVQMLVSEVVVSTSEAQHPGLINRSYTWLVENLNTDMELIVFLYRNEVLTRREREQLDCQKNRTLKNELLLSMLGRKSPDEFQLFKDALRETNQVEVVKKFDQETSMGSGSTDEQQRSTPTVNHRHGVRTTPVAKPLPLLLKPQLPPRPKVISPSNARPPSTATDKKSSSSNEVLSPKSPRSTTKLERQISQPSSPAATEISLKVASIRQNITDVQEEILKKKTNESAQLKIDTPKEIKLKENRKSMIVTQEVAEEEEKHKPASIVTNQKVTNTIEHNLQQQKAPKVDTKENESLRRELEATNHRLEFLEAESEKLKREHDVQIKGLEKQLNNVTNLCQEELKSARSDLENESKLRSEYESKLRLANHELAQLQQELKRFSSVHEDCITRNELLRQLDECGRIHEEKLAKERKTKDDTEARLAEAYKLLDDIRSRPKSKVEENEKQYSQDVSETLQELNTERRIRMEKEKLANDAERKLVELHTQLKENEQELENLKKKDDASLQDLINEKRIRIEQERLLAETKAKLLELGEQMETKEQELENLSEKYKMILQELNKEKSLRIEQERHLTEPSNKLLELGEQMKAKEQELENLSDKYRIIVQELNHEKRLKLEQERHLTETSETLLELTELMKTKEQELENLTGKYKTILQELNFEKHLRTELERHSTEPSDKLLELGEQMEAKELELENLSDKYKIILQELNNEKRLRTEQERHLAELSDEFDKQMEMKVHENENRQKEIKELLQNLANEKRLRIEQENLLSDTRENLLELGKQMESKEQRLKNEEEEKNAILKQMINEKHIRLEKEKLLSEADERILELNKQMKATEENPKNREEEPHNERRILNTNKLISNAEGRHKQNERANKQDEFAQNLEMSMQRLNNRQQMRFAQAKYVTGANREAENYEESIVQTNEKETTQVRLKNDMQQEEPELQREKKDQLKKSLEQLFSRAPKKPEEQKPKDDAQPRDIDDETPVNVNSSTSDFPESLTRIQLAPNLHVVRDRPIARKNHLIRTHAGALARISDSADDDDDDEATD